MVDDNDVPPPIPGINSNPPGLFDQIEQNIAAGLNAAENTAAARIGNIQMVSVNSSDVAAWGYDPVEGQLQIQFTNNRIYVYENISPDDFAVLSNSPSKGKAFWALIRRNPVGHPFTRLQ